MLAELNKVAIIHLFLKGFEDEISNFTLSLTNPSTQADLLKVDVWKEKILLYKDMVTAVEGIAPTSVSWAKKHILGFSDEEIKLDLQQQRIERAVANELTKTPEVITSTGLFDSLDKLYGAKTGGASAEAAPPSDEGIGGAPTPPSGGFGEPTPSESPAPPAEPAEPTLAPESVRKDVNIILEGSLVDDSEIIDLSKARESIHEIETKLNKLLED
jgi:hypothetical protein